MKRRCFLTTTATALALTAGCTGSDDPGAEADTPDTTNRPTSTQTPTTEEPTTEATTEAAPAEFELQSVDAPETAEIGEEISYSFTIKNTGGQTGVFETIIRTRTGNDRWSESDPWRQEIAPGQTSRLESQDFSFNYLASLDVEIAAVNEQFSIQFVGATPDWGESHTLGDSIEMAAVDVEFQSEYTYSYSDREYTEEPSDGQQWAFLTFRAENVGNGPVRLPTKHDIALIAGNSQYEYEIASKDEGGYEGGEVQPDIVREGWILYEVPESVSKGDLTVAYTDSGYDGDVSVFWGRDS